MKYIQLKFPDLIRLANFHINYAVTKIKIDPVNDTVTGELSDELIDAACSNYYARVVEISIDENVNNDKKASENFYDFQSLRSTRFKRS